VTDAGYVVEVKSSARRSSRTLGQWVNEHGPVRRFDTKALARAWARAASGPHATVWVQDAAPDDDTTVDGYLVGGARPGTGTERQRRETQADLVGF
jgi:hypothetical protein